MMVVNKIVENEYTEFDRKKKRTIDNFIEHLKTSHDYTCLNRIHRWIKVNDYNLPTDLYFHTKCMGQLIRRKDYIFIQRKKMNTDIPGLHQNVQCSFRDFLIAALPDDNDAMLGIKEIMIANV